MGGKKELLLSLSYFFIEKNMFHSKVFFFLSFMELRIFDTNEKSKSHYQVAFIFTKKKSIVLHPYLFKYFYISKHNNFFLRIDKKKTIKRAFETSTI